jgi:hypothetical protein
MATYDHYGWYAADQFPTRAASVAPVNLSLTETTGELRANWTGYEWVELPYAAPVITEPVILVPQVVSRAQFILALLQIDLLDEVEAAIAAADRATQINYEERLEFERSFPLIATMAAVLGKTDAEVDALFVLAATL